MPQLELLQLASSAVGGERGEPVSVDVLEAKLRAGVGAFPAHDHAHVRGPALKIKDPGEFGHVRTVTDIAVGIERGFPDVCIGEELVELRGVKREREADGVRQSAGGQPGGELLRPAGTVGADQDALARSRVAAGELREGVLHDLDVVGGGVRSRVPGPEPDRDHLPGPCCAVVDKRAEGVEPEPAFERRRGVFLLGVRGDQRRVQIDHQRRIRADVRVGGVLAGQTPRRLARGLPGLVERGEGAVRVRGQ